MNITRLMSSASTKSGLSAERPFPGLRPYLFEDHDFFFGREDQIFALYRLLDHSRFVAVVGSSGSGKSSLVRAGLLPLLDRESREPTGRVWKRIQMHPGDAPIGSLAAAMAKEFLANDEPNIAAARRERIKYALRRSSFGMSDALKEIEGLGNTSIILVVDQFEELFRYAARRQGAESEEETLRHEEATQFVQVLLAASRDRTLNVYILLTMRSDFIGECANFRGLPEAVSASQFLVPSLTRDQREEAIRRPIENAGAKIEPELVERLLNDSGDEIDQLPVLQHCLLRVWEAAGQAGGAGRCLTVQHYLEIGGITHALSKHADEILQSLSGAELAVEQAFRSLAEIDLEGRVVRRARLFKELLAETGVPEQDLRNVIDRFRSDDCSFLTPPSSEVPQPADDTRIDVGHEALLRRWERVSGDPRTGSPYTGWLRHEVADGRAYRAVLWRAESTTDRISTETVERQWAWWNERPRTAAWAERYGGHIEQVERLFKESLEALNAARERDRLQAEREREEERRHIEEAADRQRIEVEASAARDREAAALRLARLTRRAAIVVSVLLLVAIGLGVVAFRQWQAAEVQRQVAEVQSNTATQEAATANANFNKALSLTQSVASQIQNLLDKGAITVDAAQQLFSDASKYFPQFAATNDPAILTTWFKYLISSADIYMALKDNKKALEASQLAQSIATQLVSIDPNSVDYKFMLYTAEFNCGDAEPVSSSSDALTDYQKALAITQALVPTDSSGYIWNEHATFIMNKIGDVQDQQHHPQDALQTYRNALQIVQKIAAANPKIDSLQRDLANSMTRVGDAEVEINDPTDALDALTEYKGALAIRLSLASTPQGATDASIQSNLATAYSKVARVEVLQRNFTDAKSNFQSALQIGLALAGSDANNPTWQGALATQEIDVGDLFLQQGDAQSAATYYHNALTVVQAFKTKNPTSKALDAKLQTFQQKIASLPQTNPVPAKP
jgi:tetratricopeptide (TPR) repeat protein